ncbi:MAG: M48 family metalloprotease, partial [Elusimicrobia bacterium]|nr:M48 family metalloprotease [Elusimicrobiota bacterium]
ATVFDPGFQAAPVIVANTRALKGLSDEELTAVLAHEMGHVWLREAQYTADRLFVEAGDPEVDGETAQDLRLQSLEILWEIEQRADVLSVALVRELFPSEARSPAAPLQKALERFGSSEIKGYVESLSEREGLSDRAKAFDVHLDLDRRQAFLMGVDYRLEGRTLWEAVRHFVERPWPEAIGIRPIPARRDLTDLGGIDMSSDHLDLTESGDRLERSSTAAPALWTREIEGLVPVILTITPLDAQAFFTK